MQTDMLAMFEEDVWCYSVFFVLATNEQKQQSHRLIISLMK